MRLSITVLFLFAISVLCDANDVNTIYFKPTDAADIDKQFYDTILKDIQRYYQSEMMRHGFTDITYPEK